jgi:hypothetical protein
VELTTVHSSVVPSRLDPQERVVPVALWRDPQPVSVQVGGLLEPVGQSHRQLVARPHPQRRSRRGPVVSQRLGIPAGQEFQHPWFARVYEKISTAAERAGVVEPEDRLRETAERAASQARIPVRVLRGHALDRFIFRPSRFVAQAHILGRADKAPA